MADTAKSGVKITVNLNWTGLKNEMIFAIGDGDVAKYAEQVIDQITNKGYTPMTMTKQFEMTLSGLDNLESGSNITAMPGVTSETGVSRMINELYQTANIYTIP